MSIMELMVVTPAEDWEPLWLVVLVLVVVILNLYRFQSVAVVHPGDALEVGLLGCLVDLSLWTDPRVVSFDAPAVGGYRVCSSQIALVPSQAFLPTDLKIKTMDGEVLMRLVFGVGAQHYYLIPPHCRYVSCGRGDYALASDTLLGLDFASYTDSEADQRFLATFVKRLSAWERDVQQGAPVRWAAGKADLPLPLIRHLARVGKRRRLAGEDLTAYRAQYQHYLHLPALKDLYSTEQK